MRARDLERIIDPGPRINDLEMFWNSVAFRLQAVIWDALEILYPAYLTISTIHGERLKLEGPALSCSLPILSVVSFSSCLCEENKKVTGI